MTQSATLAPEDLFEHQVLDFEVLTPIHIGTREGSLKATEFISHGGQVHVLDENKFSLWLQEKGLIDGFVEEAKNGPLNLKGFLEQRGGKGWSQDLTAFTVRKIPGGGMGMQEFRPMIRDAHGLVYFPGSALKGVLRTAVLWSAVKAGRLISRDVVESRVRQGIRFNPERQKWQVFDQQSRKGKEHFSTWLQKAVLGNEPQDDLLRCLMVRDAYPVGSYETRVIELRVLCKQADTTFSKSSRNFKIWVEALMPGSRFRVELTWNVRQYHRADWRPGPPQPHVLGTLDAVLDCVREQNDKVVADEQAFFSNPSGDDQAVTSAARSLGTWYENRQGLLMRVGFGVGMISTTVGNLLTEDVRKDIRNACGHPRGSDPAPKSRRVWLTPEGQVFPMGWGRLVQPQGPQTWQALGSAECSQEPPPSKGEPHWSPHESHTSPRTQDTSQVKSEMWPSAYCTWNPGSQVVEARQGERTASTPRLKSEEEVRQVLETLPTEVQNRLYQKRRGMVLQVEVEVQGNRYQLVRLHPTSEAKGS